MASALLFITLEHFPEENRWVKIKIHVRWKMKGYVIKVHKSWKVHTVLPQTEVPGDLGLVWCFIKEGTNYNSEITYLFTAKIGIKCEM